MAEALFRDAKKLAADGRTREACEKFAESQRLDPSLGTLLNLAVCHEKEGKTASAWAEYATAAAQAARAGQSEREQFAREQGRALEARLSKMVITADEVPPGLEVRLNGEVLRAAVLGSPIPVDPGTYALEASAPGKKRWSQRVQIPAGPSSTAPRIPRLEDEAAAVAPVAPPAAEPPKAAPEPRKSPGPRVRGAADEEAPGSDRRTLGWISMGVSGVGVVVGAAYGFRTLSKKSAGDEHCKGRLCDAEGLALHDDAHRAATLSTIGFGVGLLGAGIGTWLLLSSSSSADRASAGRHLVATPIVGPGTGGVGLSGAF